jgi:4'-phosphopantetheinyl transferase EntD
MINNYLIDINHLPFIHQYTIAMPAILDNVTLVAYLFNVEHYHQYLFQQFDIHLPQAIQSSVVKRQAEYLAGRYAARGALRSLGLQGKYIPSGKHRNPLWASSISASITHTNKAAICAASFKKNYLYLGIDLEKRLNAKSIITIRSSIINLQEEKLILSCNLSFEDTFSLIFSAKESLFKALYPRVGQYFDFSAARITAICLAECSFTMILEEDLTVALTAGHAFKGYFNFDERHVFTIIAQ